MNVNEARQLFPQLSRKVYGKDLVYFDNAATSLRPRSVVERWSELALMSTSNIHRAVHAVSSEATEAYEEARDVVRAYLNASSRSEIIFTSGATMSINLVASCFSQEFFREGSEVIVTEAEHHSNIVPWQLACKRTGAVLKVVPVDDNGELDLSALKNLINENTAIVAVTHISNVLGVVNPISEVVRMCHEKNVPVLIDGSQGIVHEKVDVKELDCDFYVFSGHKFYAPTGTGVLYGKAKWLEKMPPYMGGGEMVGTVRFDETTYAPLPMKFEAGTQNYTSVPTIKEAIEIANILSDSELTNNLHSISAFLSDKLRSIDGLRIYGVPRGTTKIPLYSFTVEGAHHEDLALILDKMGIATRSGQMCAEPLMDRFGVSGMLRLSLAPYNTMEEAEYFVKCLEKAKNMLV